MSRDDVRQQIRLKRFAMAAGTYAACFGLMLLCYSFGFVSGDSLAVLGMAFLLGNAGLYVTFLTGANLRFREPSLTGPQMVMATLAIAWIVHIAAAARGLCLMLYPVPFMFGALKLPTRSLLRIGLFALLTYAWVIGLLYRSNPGAVDLRVEVLQGICLAAEIAWFALMGGYMRRLRIERKRGETELTMHRDHLKELVEERTASANRARDEAQAANRAKSDFLANMSHELRTPMHAILGFAQLGLKRLSAADDERSARYFERIHASGTRMMRLVDALLDLSKLEAGKHSFELARHDLRGIFVECAEQLQPLFETKSLAIDIDRPSVDTWVSCDLGAMSQVIHNLLSNAIKFSVNGGRVRVSFDAVRLGGPAGEPALAIAVVDEGIGIPDGEHELIFEKFTQSSKSRTGAGGTGLGLAISREIVEAHGGRIRAELHDGPGARFVMTLPVGCDAPDRTTASGDATRTASPVE